MRVFLVALITLSFTASAQANRWSDSQVNKAMQVADQHWPTSKCFGQHQITWLRSDAIDALANIPESLVVALATESGPTCQVWIAWDRINSIQMLCSILEHEYGHNAGIEHSQNPADVMYPVYTGNSSDCTKAFSHRKKHR